MICKITSNNFWTDNPEFHAIPEFDKMNSKQMKYIALTYDYETPLRKLRIKERKDRAAQIAGFKREKSRANVWEQGARDMINGKNKGVERAIEIYGSLQFNIERETLKAFDEQLSEYISIMNTKNKADDPKLLDQSIKITKELPKFIADRAELIKSLGLEANEVEEDSKQTEGLSAIDRYNMLYNRG